MDNKKKIITVISFITICLVIFFAVTKYNQYIADHQVSVYFVKVASVSKNEVMPVKRSVKTNKMAQAISELLAGPSIEEKSKGLFTEIPEGTKVISIKEFPDKYEINLSSEFSSGGGSESMKLRLEQFSSTAVDAAGKKPVYLKIKGKEAKFIGGEGLEIPAPLEKEKNS